MKRYLKIIFITLISLFLLVIISVSITIWLLFSPERLTPIVRNQSEKHIPYHTEIGEVELTLFSTFPQFGIKLNKLTVTSPAAGAFSDTLLNLDEATGVIDAKKYWKKREVVINELILSKGSANVFTDSLGKSNYGLFMKESASESEESPETEVSFINLENIEFNDLDISYIDLSSQMNVGIENLNARVSGNMIEDIVKVNLMVNNARVSYEDKGEKYLEHARLKFSIPAEIKLSSQIINLDKAFMSLNDLGITLNGSIESTPFSENIIADISYEFNSWDIQDAMKLIPLAYLSGTGINKASGRVSSKGIIKGIVNDSLMPLTDISLILENGDLSYAEFPFPLTEMNGDIRFYSDMNNAYLDINHFEAKTPHSEFGTMGKINHLFSDMHYELTTSANALLDEFRSFLPNDMDISLNGRIKGQIKTDFLMSQITNMELEKIKTSGSFLLTNFTMVYDSLFMSTDHSGIDFSLPHPNALKNNTTFAFAKIESVNLKASQIEGFNTSMKNSSIYLEMSDVRDTSLIPDLFCVFSSDSLQAGTDSVNLSMFKPFGNISLSPAKDAPGLPAIKFACSGFDVEANSGPDSLTIGDINLSADVIHDKTQEDVFLQWPGQGSIEMNDGIIALSTLSEPIGIPAIKMDFDPETFNIHDSRINIDQSDYNLTGIINNVMSYFRGDSLLRADLNFISNSTNLNQIMYLTSGIGMDEEKAVQKTEPSDEDSFTGPYMVPLGIDLMLQASVNQLINGTDTATNITGEVRINDGILVLDGLSFTTPAADMQLTAMYRTPRKNHIYLGMDYHMLDVEISRLLNMIPDIDTLMPMLRSFEGSGEFHISIETYLDSAYNIKKSTLRGASSIKGEDLVLMDGETFSEIAKTLRFSRKAENRVDSLSAEFTIFREEIDIYPFLIVMDKYKAVVGGRHNFDMSFDYHISVVNSPLPVRLGIDIKGSLDELQYRLANPRYAEFYRPSSRRVIENRQLELRKMIREALIQKVEKKEAL